MKGDVIVLEEHHKRAARKIVLEIIEDINSKKTRYTIAIGGESGSGKSEIGVAIVEELKKFRIKSVLLGQDDYFILPPKLNDARRREDPEWLGPHVEVKLNVLDQNLRDAIEGKNKILKPLIDYDNNSIEDEIVSLESVSVVIAEGTYTSLLKHIDKKVFIARNRLQTLGHRQKRNRGNEVGDPFIEQILSMEHKIIAGHKLLADFVINEDYDVIVVK